MKWTMKSQSSHWIVFFNPPAKASVSATQVEAHSTVLITRQGSVKLRLDITILNVTPAMELRCERPVF